MLLMVENRTRGGICYTVPWHAEAGKKSMIEIKNKEDNRYIIFMGFDKKLFIC